MPPTYKIIELVGTSPVGFAEAIRSAIEEASASIRHMDWFEVVSQRGRITGGKVEEFQVSVKIGFRIEHRSPRAPGSRRPPPDSELV